MKKITYKDIMPELYEMFSIIDPESLDKIVTTGLRRVNYEFINGEELLMEPGIISYQNSKKPGGFVKFYKNLSPDYYRFYIKKRDKRRAKADAKKSKY